VDRIVVLRSATLSRTFAFTPTGTPTVALARVSDGSSVTASVMSGSGTDWTYTIPATSNTLLDTYVETITAVSGSTPQTFTDSIEVAGETLFDVAEAQALSGLANATAATIVRARTRAEQILERRLGIAFVPRYRHAETLTGDGGTSLMLSMPRVRAIRSITIDGTALTVGELADLTIGPHVITGRTWRGNIIVGYEHGWDAPEEPVRQAALAMAHYYLTSGVIGGEGVDPRVEYITTPEGRINYSTDGLGLPIVQAVIQDYDMSVGVA
jgi:hypothetical protein